jgi:hypothetical protein
MINSVDRIRNIFETYDRHEAQRAERMRNLSRRIMPEPTEPEGTNPLNLRNGDDNDKAESCRPEGSGAK